jgi:hypothetical protein
VAQGCALRPDRLNSALGQVLELVDPALAAADHLQVGDVMDRSDARHLQQHLEQLKAKRVLIDKTVRNVSDSLPWSVRLRFGCTTATSVVPLAPLAFSFARNP